MSKNLSDLSFRKGIFGSLFEKMGQSAEETGTPTANDLQALADEFLIGTANTYGAVSFYDFMKEENKGKKVYVCNGSACLCAGTQDTLKDQLKSHFKEDEIGHMTCLGRCHENGAFHYQGNNYSAKEPDAIDEILNERQPANDSYSVLSNTELLTAKIGDVETYYKAYRDFIHSNQKESVLEEIKKSGLRGRGGAGFPMGLKLNICRDVESDLKFIICNADEGDPGAYSDRYLLEEKTHAVLQGMMVSGILCGAQWGILYIRAEYPDSVTKVQAAIEELREAELIGGDILGSGVNFDFKIIKAQGAYICGEETALINSIEGQRPEVRTRPPYPTVEGLFNKPTVVNNVETLASVPFILKNGGSAYNAIGTEKSSGTKLLSLDSYFNNPGIVEVEMGTPLEVVIHDLGGGFRTDVKAMQIGGPLGGIVPVHKISELNVDFESFGQNGFLLGHASIVCIPEAYPMINYLEHLFDFAQYESCGKCFPCRLGTKRGHELLVKSIKEDYKIDRTLFDDLLNTLQEGSLCAHGGGIPLPVKNALHYFKEELAPHFVN
ncbi:MAG: NADH-ubiquinone oxidoreductase-F iron-sulfur binding region domain-containing protein [Saprospiraceae bacterium]|nr:NADH-ubiquinone oxidoreductase-F iron-sulfur binding region domain-containing protein [Saprospiraceae bacterium]